MTVSGRTGEGIDDLRAALDALLGALPVPDPSARVRLWVDRRFHVRGAGTVVTGTLPAGTIRPGDRLDTGSGEVRVRGLESLGVARESVSGTARVAIDLAGDVPDGWGREGVLSTPGAFEWADVVDVGLRVPAGAATVERLPERLRLHIGSAALDAHVRPFGERHARLTLPAPYPWRVGDRAILRDPGSRALWGVEVVDCAPPRLRRRGAARSRAEELASWQGTVADQVRARGLVHREWLDRVGARGSQPDPGTVEAEGWLLSATRAGAARTRLAELVAVAGDDGVAVDAVARTLELPDALVRALVEAPLRLEAGRVRHTTTSPLPAHLQRAVAELRADLAASPFAAPDAARLRDLGLDERAVTLLHRRGEVVHVGSSVVLLPDAPDEAVRRLSELEQPFTTSQARQALQTSRRVVLPLLAHLDRTQRTVRLPDDRRRVRGGA